MSFLLQMMVDKEYYENLFEDDLLMALVLLDLDKAGLKTNSLVCFEVLIKEDF